MLFILFVVIFMINICKFYFKIDNLYRLKFKTMLLNFPNEILSYIIENLDFKDRNNISLTCKKLNQITKNSYIKDLRLIQKQDNKIFLNHCKVKKLKLYRIIYPEILYNFFYIQILEIYNLYINYIDLETVLKKCYNLKILKLSDCHGVTRRCLEPLKDLKYFKQLDILSGNIFNFPNELNNLKILNICNYFNKNINLNFIKKFKNYKNLKKIKFSKILNIEKNNLLELQNLNLESISLCNCHSLHSFSFLTSFKTLKELTIINSTINDNDFNILLTSNITKYNLSNSIKLKGNIKTINNSCKELDLFSCLNLREENLKTFKNLINLEIINLQRCKSLFDSYFELKHNKNLKQIFVNSMDVTNYIELKESLPKLKIIIKK